MTLSAPIRVTVAVLTFRRPDDLRAALPILLAQAEEVVSGPESPYQVEVVVIDNDSTASAEHVVKAFDSPLLRYVVEAEPGIAAARNRALSESAESDLLVFIDDDERPHDRWLRLLLDTRSATGAVAVAGAVVSKFAEELDPWLAAGEFFRRRRLITGTPIDVAATNNLLLDLREVRRLGLRFDLEFGQSGGEDTLFTRTISAGGGRMVWCNEAVVTDWVPVSRMTRRWVLQRAVSSGNSVSRVELRLANGIAGRSVARARACRAALPRLFAGAVRYLFGVCANSSRHQAKGLRTMARGAGMLSGAFGHVFQEYRRV